MKSWIEALNHPVEAFRKGSKSVSWVLVIITILINSVFEPVLRYFYGTGASSAKGGTLLKMTGLGLLSYILLCILLWAVCRCFGSKATLMNHVNAWGISFFPTVLCSLTVAITEVFFQIFWNSTLWGMLLNILFIGILIWKATLFIVYLREFAGLRGWRFYGAFVSIGFIMITMAALNGYLGLKTPIL